MRITAAFDDDRCLRGTLTKRPAWIARLFGRRSRVARIHWGNALNDWRFADGEWVGSELERIIKQEARWRMVGELPIARALETSRTP